MPRKKPAPAATIPATTPSPTKPAKKAPKAKPPKDAAKARAAAIAQIDQRLDALDAPGDAPKAKRAKTDVPKRTSALDAAATVLADAPAGGLATKDLLDQMAKRKLWSSPGGKTPGATLYAAMVREMRAKGDQSRFKRVAPGRFAAAKPRSLKPAKSSKPAVEAPANDAQATLTAPSAPRKRRRAGAAK